MSSYADFIDAMSHPMWVRGLKHNITPLNGCRPMSHPMWVRGLKHQRYIPAASIFVAPYVGAWIETLIISIRDSSLSVAPYVGAWIETYLIAKLYGWSLCRTLCGCVD